VNVYINGVASQFGAAFIVDGEKVIFTKRASPEPGDTLRAVYETAASSRGISGSVVPITNDRTKALVEKALLESIVRHGVTPDAPTRVAELVPDAIERRTTAVKDRTLSSLSMLTRRIGASKKSTAAMVGRGTMDASGVEGTGDLPVESPYSALLGVDDSRSNVLSGLTPTDRGVKKSPQFRSISMLQRRLDDADQERRKVEGGEIQ